MFVILFYIFSHEKDFKVYNSNEQRLAELKAEYQNILERLDRLEQEGIIGAFDKRTIIELSSDVIKEIAQKYKNVQKGVGDIMNGALPIEKIAEYTGLDVAKIEQLAER